MVFSPADGILRRLRLGHAYFFKKNVPVETINSNRFGLECAFILGDLPMSARFFQLNLPISNLILTNLPRIFGLVAICLGPSAYC